MREPFTKDLDVAITKQQDSTRLRSTTIIILEMNLIWVYYNVQPEIGECFQIDLVF